MRGIHTCKVHWKNTCELMEIKVGVGTEGGIVRKYSHLS